MSDKKEACPCGGADYQHCCRPYIEGGVPAPDAQALMRSRYTAYVLGNEDYLRATWHPRTRPAEKLTGEGTRWLGLEVKRHHEQGDQAQVEFVARYRVGGQGHRLHELSNFEREDGRWLYVDGSFPEKKKR